MPDLGESWPYLVMLAGALVTYFWRGLGVALSGRLDTRSPLFEWTACVAYALLAGLVARMIVSPLGALGTTALADRLAAAAVSLLVFFLARRNLLAGVTAGALVLVALTWWRGPAAG